MADLLYHKDAKQYYVVPVVDNKRQTVYLGRKKRAAKTACRKILAKVEKSKRGGNHRENDS